MERMGIRQDHTQFPGMSQPAGWLALLVEHGWPLQKPQPPLPADGMLIVPCKLLGALPAHQPT